MSSLRQNLGSRNGLFFVAILAGTLAYLLYCLYVDYALGGNDWKQGDWLINELSEPARRGLFGSALLLTSDALRLDPLLLLVLFQGVVVTAIFVVVGIAALDLKVPNKLLLILLSPGFVIFFWFNDPQGSVRKEMLSFLAFLPLIVAALRGKGSHLAYALSMIAYAVAVFAHEANVFFLPFLWIAMWMVLPDNASFRLRLMVLAVPFLLAFAGGLYATAFSHVSDWNVICQQVTDRGIDPSVCGGAIKYLVTSPDEATRTLSTLVSIYFRNFLLLYAVCLISFRVLFQDSAWSEWWFFAVIASGIVFFPLYIVAGDYGRWLNFHISALVFVALVFLLKWRPPWLYEQPKAIDFYILLAVSFVIGIRHVPGELIDGPLVKVVLAVHDLVTS